MRSHAGLAGWALQRSRYMDVDSLVIASASRIHAAERNDCQSLCEHYDSTFENFAFSAIVAFVA